MDKIRQHTRDSTLFQFDKEGSRNISKSQNQVVLPSYIDDFTAIRRLTSKTAISPLATITSSYEVDFDLISPNGHLEEVYAEIQIAELGGTTQSTFIGYDMFDRIEVECPEGTLFKVIYPDQLYYLEKLNQNLLQFNRAKVVELLQSNYQPIANTVNAGSTTLFYLKIPAFDEMPDLRWLGKNNGSNPLLRFYFKAPTSFVMSGSTNLGISYFNLIIKQVPTPLNYLSIDKTFRYTNWQRFTNILTLAANSQYNLQLNTIFGYAAYLVILIRNAPVASNGTNFCQPQNAIQNFELHDASNNIIAINQPIYMNRFVMNRHMSGDIFDSSLYPYIYTVVFSLNPDDIRNKVTGGYQFTSKEVLLLNTNPILTTGSFEISVWAANYDYYTFKADGNFTFTR